MLRCFAGAKEPAIQFLNPTKVRYSQRWVSYQKVRGATKYTYSNIVNAMKDNDWMDEPIDVVRVPDGQLTTIDNTRVLTARNAGINLQVRVLSIYRVTQTGVQVSDSKLPLNVSSAKKANVVLKKILGII